MGTIAEKLAHLVETKSQIKAAIEAKGVTVPADATFRDYVALIEGISGSSETATYLLITEDGQEIPAVEVGEEVIFTATANDIREGAVAATAEGVTTGTKAIPAYHTTVGVESVSPGGEVKITGLSDRDAYDYTKLQAIICTYNASTDESVAAEWVAIEGNVYAVQSTDVVATITKDSTNKVISFGITNTGSEILIIRYFTLKEEI